MYINQNRYNNNNMKITSKIKKKFTWFEFDPNKNK